MLFVIAVGLSMIEIRFHGRGGQGAKIASRILGRCGFLAGLHAQDFALFGAERRGAPVVSFTRLDTEAIQLRGNIERPDLVIIMDVSLLGEATEQVFQGVHATTQVIVNSARQPPSTITDLPSCHFHWMDMDPIAKQAIGRPFVSAIAAAVAAKCVPALKLDQLVEAVRAEISDFGGSEELIENNLVAARHAYALTPALDLTRLAGTPEGLTFSSQAIAHPRSSELIGPTIKHRGSAALRATGNWRIERPFIDLTKCKRCFLCYLYCPEAAMRLDSNNFPYIDFDHCKGCMICYQECPTEAISRRSELCRE
jgi:pyruvate ferredoxin oxidoreductase gamma subunit